METKALCGECGALIHNGANFCSNCGGRTEHGHSAQGDRRQLTVFFCDVVGSTQLSEKLEPEDLGDLLSSYQRVCRDAIVRHEGHVSQFLGDGVLAYFGYPAAHEDDAVRAVRAALSILDALRFINEGIGKRLHVEVHVRMGLHTGVVLIGDGVERRERLAVGETVNLASRIEALAPADSVVISAETASLISGHFHLEPQLTQTLRGFSRPVELFRVVSPTGARSKFEVAAGVNLTPHVDRNAELSLLRGLWNEIENGASRVVLIRGEAGVGKSRTLHQFKSAILGEGTTEVNCFCSPLAQSTALAPVIEMLEERVLDRLVGEVTAATRLDALRIILGEHSRLGSDALPLMAALLSIPGADEAPIQDLSLVRRRTRTYELFRAWVASTAERVPVVLFFEDVQWADPSTLELIDMFVRDPPAGRAMLCVTARPEFSPTWDDSQAVQIKLDRLPATHTDEMIAKLAGESPLPEFVARRIAERSEGVPLYVEELTKLVVDRLRIDPALPPKPAAPSLLPSTIRGALEARLDRVGAGRRTAQLGAAIGRDFSYSLIRAVAGGDEMRLREELDMLSRSELAFVEGVPPQATYRFKHALIQDAIYDTIPKNRRSAFHDRIFEVLTNEFTELIETRPEMAAHHAELAQRPEAAVRFLLRAGLMALQRQAVVEAARHLSHGLDLIGVLEESPRIELELEFQAAIGPAYMATLGWAAAEVERSCMRMLQLARAAGDSAKIYRARWGLWTVHFVRGDQNAAIEAAEIVYDMATLTADPMLRITGCHALGYTSYFRADFATAKRIALEAISLSTLERETELASMFALSSGSIAYGICTVTHWLLGEQDQAAEMLSRWHELLAKLKHAPSTVLSLAYEGYLLHMMREARKLRALALRLRTIAEQEGFKIWISMSHIFEIWALAQEGQLSNAVERMNAAISNWLTTSSRLTMCDNTVMQAEVVLLAGHADDALKVIENGKELCAKLGERTLEPELYRLEGEAFEQLGRRDAAVEATQLAAARAAALGALSLELRAVIQLHRLSSTPESLERLRSTYQKFTEGFDQPDMRLALSYIDPGGFNHAERATAG